MTIAFDDDDAETMVEALSFDVEAVVNGSMRIPVLFLDPAQDAFGVASAPAPVVKFATGLWPQAARGDVLEIDPARWAVVKVERDSRSKVTTVQLEKQTT
jgi:hypothetical protein